MPRRLAADLLSAKQIRPLCLVLKGAVVFFTGPAPARRKSSAGWGDLRRAAGARPSSERTGAGAIPRSGCFVYVKGMRSFRIALLVVLAAACGGNGLPPSSDFANLCATPRPGTDDRKGSLDDEKKFLRSWTDELYLWYREVPAVDASKYNTADDYFFALKTPATTPSGDFKDRFHFIIPSAEWHVQSQGGPAVGYGVNWAVLGSKCASGNSGICAPRDVRVAYTQPGSSAASL